MNKDKMLVSMLVLATLVSIFRVMMVEAGILFIDTYEYGSPSNWTTRMEKEHRLFQPQYNGSYSLAPASQT